MKLKINRLLRSGKYHVNFEVTNFTPDELHKMSGFGVPMIDINFNIVPGGNTAQLALTQIAPAYDAYFDTEQAADEYQDRVKGQIEQAMRRLRGLQDKYTSSHVVDL